MKKTKYTILAFLLFASATIAAENNWKHKQQISTTTTNGTPIDIEVEFKTDKDFSDPTDNIQVQIRSLYKELDNFPGAISLGIRFISENRGDNGKLVPFLEFNNSWLYNNKQKMNNRIRWMYNIQEGDDKQVFRYQLSTKFKTPDFDIKPAVELFSEAIDGDLEYARVRYSVMLTKALKNNNWTIGAGYEYNDNHKKADSETFVTQAALKF